ncbi:MAG TPA: trypsin-like peptidase domain-containing protein [Chloroflexota bacterium]|nr:trypsin-like peptidase domain-containing protein [Chloroflexota bacterium]
MTREVNAEHSLLALSESLVSAVETAGHSVVGVAARRRGAASGVHWQPGVVVTADHAVEQDEDIKLILEDGTRHAAKLAGRDSTTDLAVLRLEGERLRPTAAINAEAVKAGRLVVAVGRPGDGGVSVSFGAVSAVSGAWRTWAGGKIDQLVRPDVTFYPGFSGGPLVDMAGRVLGINTSGLSRHMSLTIPAATVNRVVEQLLRTGRIARGYLGLRMQSVVLPEASRAQLGLESGTGLVVMGVEPDGPASGAGILLGDILVAIDGNALAHSDAVQAALDPETVGKPVTLSVIRGGSPMQVTVTVGERPRRERHHRGGRHHHG